eukprot:g49359.t1
MSIIRRWENVRILSFLSLLLLVHGLNPADPLANESFSPGSCIWTLKQLLQNGPQSQLAVEIMNAASTSTCRTRTIFGNSSLPVDVGSYDMCQSTPGLQHCVAGSVNMTDRFANPDPLSGICVPLVCSNNELTSPSVAFFIAEALSSIRQDPTEPVNMPRLAYLIKLKDTLAITNATGTGYTCGNNSAPYTFHNHIFFYLVASLAFCVFLFTVIHVNVNHIDDVLWGLRPLTEAFSLVYVYKYVMKSRGRAGSFNVLDGLRALSILWIILGHTLARQTSVGVLNITAVVPPTGFLREWWAQPIFSSRFAVDTFLFISGLLVCSGLLSFLDPIVKLPLRISNGEPKRHLLAQWLSVFYMRRIVRILPLYMFCLVLWWQIGVLLGSGPFWYRWESFIHKCNLYWWTHVLFINNLYPLHATETDGCYEVSWYLAVDMQLYVIAPFFVLLYVRSRTWGSAFALLTLFCSVGGAALATVVLDLSAHSFDGLWILGYARHLYTKPWFCVTPYLVGMMTAAVWHEKERHYKNFRLNRRTANFLLFLLCCGFLLCACGAHSAYQNRPCSYYEFPGSNLEVPPCGSGWPLWLRALHVGGGKLIWSGLLAMLTLLSANGQGAILGSFLAHPAWAPLAKLSFAVYLLHTLFLNIWYFGRAQKVVYSHFDFTMTYLGITVVSFAAGALVMALVEIPAHKLWMLIQPNAVTNFQRVDTAHVIKRSSHRSTLEEEDKEEEEEDENDEVEMNEKASLRMSGAYKNNYGSEDQTGVHKNSNSTREDPIGRAGNIDNLDPSPQYLQLRVTRMMVTSCLSHWDYHLVVFVINTKW